MARFMDEVQKYPTTLRGVLRFPDGPTTELDVLIVSEVQNGVSGEGRLQIGGREIKPFNRRVRPSCELDNNELMTEAALCLLGCNIPEM